MDMFPYQSTVTRDILHFGHARRSPQFTVRKPSRTHIAFPQVNKGTNGWTFTSSPVKPTPQPKAPASEYTLRRGLQWLPDGVRIWSRGFIKSWEELPTVQREILFGIAAFACGYMVARWKYRNGHRVVRVIDGDTRRDNDNDSGDGDENDEDDDDDHDDPDREDEEYAETEGKIFDGRNTAKEGNNGVAGHLRARRDKRDRLGGDRGGTNTKYQAEDGADSEGEGAKESEGGEDIAGKNDEDDMNMEDQLAKPQEAQVGNRASRRASRSRRYIHRASYSFPLHIKRAVHEQKHKNRA